MRERYKAIYDVIVNVPGVTEALDDYAAARFVQPSFDDGTAGRFQVKRTVEGGIVITVERIDDEDYIADDAGDTHGHEPHDHKRACEQLMAEFAEDGYDVDVVHRQLLEPQEYLVDVLLTVRAWDEDDAFAAVNSNIHDIKVAAKRATHAITFDSNKKEG